MNKNFQPFRPEPAFVPVRSDENKNYHYSSSSSSANDAQAYRSAGNDSSGSGAAKQPKNQKKTFHPKVLWEKFNNLDKNKKIIIASALTGLLVVIFGLVWYYVIRAEPAPPPPPPPAPVVNEEPKEPTEVPSPLTGVMVKPELAKMPTTGVMIENSPDARPQSGLYDAGVVYEAISEGGITRFLALYQESSPKDIGPVRSVRPYYLDFLKPYDAPIAHVGGSAAGLAQIRNQNFKDLDQQIAANSGYYQRVSHRYAPHNMYTSREKLLEIHKKNGWMSSKVKSFPRKKEAKAKKPTAKSIDLNISSYLYNVHYDYDAKSNSYKRVMGGVAHNDAAAKKQNNPKVVIALVSSHHYSGVYSVYDLNGKGTAYIFQDGKAEKVTWNKKNRSAQFSFTNKDKETVALNPGQTWITLVGSSDAVTYKP